MLELAATDSLRLLAGLDGLELGRIGVLEFLSDHGSASISGSDEKRITVKTEVSKFACPLSESDCELLKCCCLDVFLNAYPAPHLDLEIRDLDFTIAFR